MIRKAAILAVGTELTTGQTLNTNASWLSNQLVSLGVEVVEHRVVADDRPMIQAALHELSRTNQLLVVTGGLGPTSDDFTRDEIAVAAHAPLAWHPETWTQISTRLSSMGIRVAENNRQQCFFPDQSTVLDNPAGTAAGFRLQVGECHWVVLPGPPREVEAIWSAGLGAWLVQQTPGLQSDLLTWQCLGKSEAELGEMTEEALQGSNLLTGYRAHRPYIEIKVWVPTVRTQAHSEAIRRLEERLSPWLVQRPGEISPIEAIFRALARKRVGLVIEEGGMSGLVVDRWNSASRKFPGVLTWVLASPSVGALTASRWQDDLAARCEDWIHVGVTPGSTLETVQVHLERHEKGRVTHQFNRELRSPFRLPAGAEAEVEKSIRDRVLRWAVEASMLCVKDCLEESGFLA